MTGHAATSQSGSGIAESFRSAIPSLAVVDDPQECALASSDIAGPGAATAAAILRPDSEEQAAAIVSVARREGCALFPRGGGWSYTGGYTPSQSPAAIVDAGLLRTISVERDAARVTAGAGATWAALDDALNAAGLRVPSFGPLSGIGATVGGLTAQDGGFFGTAGHGPVGESSIISSTIVAGTGETVKLTASDRADGIFAPQPLAGDCGAFGLRTAVTLAVMPRPATAKFGSFAFSQGEDALAALVSLAGIPGLGEVYVFDPGVHANLARGGFSLSEGASFASDLLAAGHGLSGLADVVRAARWTRSGIADIGWSLHVCVEGDDEAAREALAEAARSALTGGGQPMPDVIPRVTRARPFRRIKALLGPEGELWLPLHGVFGLADAARGLSAVKTTLAEWAGAMRTHEIRAAILMTLMGRRVVIEPQLFWPDALSPLHRRFCQPDQVAAFGDRPARPAARAAVLDLRRALIDAIDRAGAGHFQIGRSYSSSPGVSAAARERWASWKQRLDPDRIMNPGVLGL